MTACICVVAAIREKGDSGIGAVKRSLPAEVSYGQIKVVAALMQAGAAWFASAAVAQVCNVSLLRVACNMFGGEHAVGMQAVDGIQHCKADIPETTPDVLYAPATAGSGHVTAEHGVTASGSKRHLCRGGAFM